MRPAHMPTGLDYDQRLSVLDSTRNDEGPSYLAYLMSFYPTQFSSADVTAVLAAPGNDRTTAFLPLNKYIANDTRYTNSSANDSRIVDCGPF